MKTLNKPATIKSRKQQGFTLIEVLVAVIILVLGLVGLAGLQTVGISNNQRAYVRSQASQLAYDIADRIRNSGIPQNYVTANGFIPQCPNGTNPCTSCTSNANQCTPQNLAGKDLFEWMNAIRDTLPVGRGMVELENPADPNNRLYRVTIQWTDKYNRDEQNPDDLNAIIKPVSESQFVLRFRVD